MLATVLISLFTAYKHSYNLRNENDGELIICFSYILVQVSYNVGLRHFTIHSYPMKKASCSLSCFMKARRTRKDFRFLAFSTEEAVQWVGGFADQQCYVNILPHPLASSKKQASSELIPMDTPSELIFKCKSPPKMLVILNPRSGRGRSSKVFHGVVEPIFKVWYIAGFCLLRLAKFKCFLSFLFLGWITLF